MAATSPTVVEFGHPDAPDVALTGGEAAALVRAASAGLPTLDRVVLTRVFSNEVDDGAEVTDGADVADG